MGKYDPLRERLTTDGRRVITMSFAEIIAELGVTLPASATDHRAWWANDPTHVHAKAWLMAGYKVDAVDQSRGTVRFVRQP